MLALFHRRSTLLSLLALVAAAVYYQVFRIPPTTETETMTAQVSRSVIQAVFAREQAEVSSIP
jgi:23S rRNA maturation mini-RNase III